MRVVTCSLPFWANSGQSADTGASMSSWPREARTWAHKAVAPLVQEKTMPTVSRVQGVPFLSTVPPHRSTTVSPPTVRHTEAPTSPCSAKFLAKASATRSKPFLQVPSTLMLFSRLGWHRQLEHLQDETRGVAEAGLVDAVADALGDVHADLHAVLAQQLGGALGQHVRQHLVAVAVQEQHRRPCLDLGAQRVGIGQHAREADDARELPGAAQADMQRHHRALAEAHQHCLALVESIFRHRVVKEGVDEGRGGAHARGGDMRIEPRDAEPLEARRI